MRPYLLLFPAVQVLVGQFSPEKLNARGFLARIGTRFSCSLVLFVFIAEFLGPDGPSFENDRCSLIGLLLHYDDADNHVGT